ncbi:formin-like protein 5 [Triticum aestivum]|uniref:formin-like protein 5 n=1 Tax=Triticum aestivum TaxID=4565 RepID=UPI001D011BEB|nr:formin-like protein 5 [Triticum aestivum]
MALPRRSPHDGLARERTLPDETRWLPSRGSRSAGFSSPAPPLSTPPHSMWAWSLTPTPPPTRSPLLPTRSTHTSLPPPRLDRGRAPQPLRHDAAGRRLRHPSPAPLAGTRLSVSFHAAPPDTAPSPVPRLVLRPAAAAACRLDAPDRSPDLRCLGLPSPDRPARLSIGDHPEPSSNSLPPPYGSDMVHPWSQMPP